MRQEILDKLAHHQLNDGMDILLAIESGSRAWGFASPDSDFDVRFMYRRRLSQYLSFRKLKDTSTLEVNEVFDLVGWDLQKALHHISRSNAVMYEWLQSPTTYLETAGFREALWPIALAFFNPKGVTHHYLSLAVRSYEAAQLPEGIRLKKYFYVLRPLLAARWIRTRETVPPMEFGPLVMALEGEAPLREAIAQLLDRKAVSDEKAIISAVPAVEQFIASEFEEARKAAHALPAGQATPADWDRLDAFFFEMIHAK